MYISSHHVLLVWIKYVSTPRLTGRFSSVQCRHTVVFTGASADWTSASNQCCFSSVSTVTWEMPRGQRSEVGCLGYLAALQKNVRKETHTSHCNTHRGIHMHIHTPAHTHTHTFTCVLGWLGVCVTAGSHYNDVEHLWPSALQLLRLSAFLFEFMDFVTIFMTFYR